MNRLKELNSILKKHEVSDACLDEVSEFLKKNAIDLHIKLCIDNTSYIYDLEFYRKYFDEKMAFEIAKKLKELVEIEVEKSVDQEIRQISINLI